MKLLGIIPIQRKGKWDLLILVAEVESDEAEVVQVLATEENNIRGSIEFIVILEVMVS